jgi:hypothetical protein
VIPLARVELENDVHKSEPMQYSESRVVHNRAEKKPARNATGTDWGFGDDEVHTQIVVSKAQSCWS